MQEDSWQQHNIYAKRNLPLEVEGHGAAEDTYIAGHGTAAEYRGGSIAPGIVSSESVAKARGSCMQELVMIRGEEHDAYLNEYMIGIQ